MDRFKPAYVRAYLALSNDAFQMLLDTEMSAFVEVKKVGSFGDAANLLI